MKNTSDNGISCKCGNNVQCFFFHRKKFFDHFVCDGPTWLYWCFQYNQLVHHKYEWGVLCYLYEPLYLGCKPKKESPVLLLSDNHQSHLSIKLITLCIENGIVLLSFPPHCSHKLQPLDRSVFWPFKKCLANAQASWMKSSPWKVMSIYDL